MSSSDDIINRAINFATKAHEKQERKFERTKYIEHPLAVADLVATVKDSKRNKDIIVAAAILHDVIEDTKFDYDSINDLFGWEVADIVKELTNSPTIKGSKKGYLLKKMVGMSSYALVIKLADILHNISYLNYTPFEFKRRLLDRAVFIVDSLPNLRQLTQTHLIFIKAIKRKIIENVV